MKRSSIGTIALAATTVLTTAVWAHRGGGAGGPGGPTSLAAHGQSHAKATAPSKDSDRSADFESRLASNSQLSSRLQSLLPPKTTLQTAASGFKNQGQFVAALHVSHNLNIPFDQLKTAMMTTKHDSLGAAIRKLRPDLDSKTVNSNLKLAERQAKTDVQASNRVAESSST
jgi:hypothetical protein